MALPERLEDQIALYKNLLANMHLDRAAEFAAAAKGRTKEQHRKLVRGSLFLAPLGVFVYGEVLAVYNHPSFADYRRCRLYSVAVPDGEEADVHLSAVLVQLTGGQFASFRAARWPNTAAELGLMLADLARAVAPTRVLN